MEVRRGQQTPRFDKFPYEQVEGQSFSLLFEVESELCVCVRESEGGREGGRERGRERERSKRGRGNLITCSFLKIINLITIQKNSPDNKYARLESLDLICDRKDSFEEWMEGLSTLVSSSQWLTLFPPRYENTDPTIL